MRELEFRAWDNIGKGMFGQGMRPQKFWSMVHPSSCDVFVMQYTGLTDSEGVKIFEGDIVEDIKPVEGLPENYQISWSKNRARFMCSNGNYGFWITSDVRVIGNIYESPELIGETND